MGFRLVLSGIIRPGHGPGFRLTELRGDLDRDRNPLSWERYGRNAETFIRSQSAGLIRVHCVPRTKHDVPLCRSPA
jgi:hypothetical protein